MTHLTIPSPMIKTIISNNLTPIIKTIIPNNLTPRVVTRAVKQSRSLG